MSKFKPLARRSDIVIQEFGNEILIYDLQTNKAYNLNETSALIWQLSNGERSVIEIANELTQRLDSPINKDFVLLALEQFKKQKLIENSREFSSFFDGVSRREIIKRIGLSTFVAFPLVSSLIAPNSIHAASSTCRQISSSCTGWGRAAGCVCLNASSAGNPGVSTPYPANPGNTAGDVGAGNSNCLAGLKCFSSAVLGGGGNACCTSVTSL